MTGTGTNNELGSTGAGTAAPKAQWSVVITLALATLVIASELTLAAMALPLVSNEFAVSPSATAWVLLAYTLPLVALAIPAGRWVDGADVRLVYLLSLTLVALTGIASALVQSFAALLVARVLQGLASALYLAVFMPVVSTSVSPPIRGRALSLITSVMMLGSVAVTPLGGLVAEAFGWRAVFLIKVPLLVLVVLLGGRLLAKTHPRASLRERLPAPSPSLLVETLFIGAAVTALLLALESVEGDLLLASALGMVSIAVLMAWTRLDYSQPVITLLSQPRFALPALALILVAALIGLTGFTLPFFMLEVMELGPQSLSIAILGFVLAAAAVSPLAGSLADRYGALNVAAAGAGLTALGLLTLLMLDAESTLWSLTLCTAATGAGMAVFNAPNMAAILEAAPSNMTGTASGISSVARMLGSTIGPAVAALIWTLSQDGVTALHNTVLALSALAALGFISLIVATRSRRVAESPQMPKPIPLPAAPQVRAGE